MYFLKLFFWHFSKFKTEFIAYRSSKVSSRPDCIFEIYQLRQSGFSRVYSNWCCSCWFEPEIIKIGQSSHKMYSNNIVNFQESTTILNAYTKSPETYWRTLVSIEITLFSDLWPLSFAFIIYCFCHFELKPGNKFKKLPLSALQNYLYSH